MDVDKKLIEVFGLDQLSENAKEQNVSYLSNALFKNIGIAIAEKLSDNDLEQFNTLLKESGNKALDFLSTKTANIELIVSDEIAKMKQQKDELFS
jgi:hypothetical protein